MKRALSIVLALTFVSMFLVSNVAAATSQGLEWGVVLNDEFQFSFDYSEIGEDSLSVIVNATVDATPPTIPDPLSDWLSIPWFDIEFELANGSMVPPEFLALFGFIAVGGLFVVPVGNYTLLSELAMDSLWWTDNHTIVNDATYWGIQLSATDGDEIISLYVHYLKTDGMCGRYELQLSNSTHASLGSASFVRLGLGFDIVGFIQDNMLLVGIGIAVIVILGAIVCRRR
jgi:hypothetical protein